MRTCASPEAMSLAFLPAQCRPHQAVPLRMPSSARAGSVHSSKGAFMANNYYEATGVLVSTV